MPTRSWPMTVTIAFIFVLLRHGAQLVEVLLEGRHEVFQEIVRLLRPMDLMRSQGLPLGGEELQVARLALLHALYIGAQPVGAFQQRLEVFPTSPLIKGANSP